MNKIIILFLAFLLQYSALGSEKLPYNFSDTNYVPIKMSIINDISSNDEIYEGQEIQLKIKNNVAYRNSLLIKKGSLATARIETIITKGMNGFPAEIILNNFKIDGIDSNKLMGEYTETGRNWALMVYPIKWALTPIPFVGSLTNLIKGGEAHIRPCDTILVKYYPNW